MDKKSFLKCFIILIVSIFCFNITNLHSFALTNSKIKSPVKSEKTQVKAIRCNNCPCNCLIKPNQTGDCGQYKNVNGKLVSTKS